MSRYLIQSARTRFVDDNGFLTEPVQRNLAKAYVLDSLNDSSNVRRALQDAFGITAGLNEVLFAEGNTLRVGGSNASDNNFGLSLGGWGFFGIDSPGLTNGRLVVLNNGNVGINQAAPTSKLSIVGIQVFANNLAALGGGLKAGDLYRTGTDPDYICIVH